MTQFAYTPKQGSLVDVLDRLLDTGAVVDGEIFLTVADIDLVYLGLKLVLASVETLKPAQGGERQPVPPLCDRAGRREAAGEEVIGAEGGSHWGRRGGVEIANTLPPLTPPYKGGGSNKIHIPTRDIPSTGPSPSPTYTNEVPEGKRINMDPKKVEKGLAKLVMTVVELIRQLMEKQAIRRIEGNSLSPKDIERLGTAFKSLKEKCDEMKTIFGLNDEDLNLDLGPLGNLNERDGG